MNMQTTMKSTHPMIVAAAVSVALFSLVGTAALLGWIPASKSTPVSDPMSQAIGAHKLAAVEEPKAEAKIEPRAEAQPAPVRRPAAQSARPKAQPAVQPEESGYRHPAPLRAEPAPYPVYAEPALRTAQAEPAAEPVRKQCYECGVIESVRESEKPGDTNGVGIGVGAVAGGVLGHQMGNGRGRDAMAILGAIGGAVAGHQIEKKVKKTVEYRVTVRFEDGTTTQMVQTTPPAWREGDKVKVVNGALVANG